MNASPVIRAARIDGEPLLLGVQPRLPPGAPANEPAARAGAPANEPAARAGEPAAAESNGRALLPGGASERAAFGAGAVRAAPAVSGALASAAALASPAGVASAAGVASPAAAASAAPSSDVLRLRLLRESLAAERQGVLERAREQGHREGMEQGRAEYEAQLDALRRLIGSLHAALADGIAGSEDVIVEIAFEAVGKILGDALARREGVQAAVREAIRGVREREHLVVRVSPRDHELLGGRLPKNGDVHRIELLADERVELGGCLIETAGGTLDGRLETQLQRLRDTLVGAARTQPQEAAS